MKKVFILAAAALFMGTAANAQDVYKQTGGEQNLEVRFAPLGGSPIGITGIKYRSFTSATTAFRANVFLGFSSNTDITTAGDNELKDVTSNFNISIAPGIEKHFAGTDRLSPYVGAEVVIGFNSEADKGDMLVGTDVETLTEKNGSLFFGANAVAGVDFYFADNLYVGAEIGFGLQFTTEFDTTFDWTGSGDGPDDVPNGSSFGIGPNVVGAIRLGWLF